MRRQSVEIKELVQDLNLVSRLEYDMQPLNMTSVRLSKLLREYAVELINGGLSEQYSITLTVSPEAEGVMLDCDPRLITRAVNGLVQNSLRHNTDGCRVALSLGLDSGGILISVADDGVGISSEKLRELEQTPHYMDSTDESLNLRHGLGLIIVRQIVAAHGGEFTLQNLPEKGLKATMRFPA